LKTQDDPKQRSFARAVGADEATEFSRS